MKKCKNNSFTLGIIGIGRVGLPLALTFGKSGIRVVAVDKNGEYVEKLRRALIGWFK